MINVKKGPAHSLGQADVRGAWDGTTALVAGQVAYINGTGTVVQGTAKNGDTPGFIGLVIDGPAVAGQVGGNAAVNESGKIALYTFDGSSIIETDQAYPAINSTNYPIGSAVYAYGSDAAGKPGMVTNATGSKVSSTVIGWVEGIRNLQKDSNTTFAGQNYTSVDSQGNTTTKSFAYKGQQNSYAMLAIKLAAIGSTTAAAS